MNDETRTDFHVPAETFAQIQKELNEAIKSADLKKRAAKKRLQLAVNVMLDKSKSCEAPTSDRRAHLFPEFDPAISLILSPALSDLLHQTLQDSLLFASTNGGLQDPDVLRSAGLSREALIENLRFLLRHLNQGDQS